MTGYARIRRQTPTGELTLSVKSVNHRGLDMRFHLPPELEFLENAVRERVARKMARGHVDVRIGWNRAGAPGGFGLNRPLLDAYMAAFREAAEAYGIDPRPDLSAALRTPGMLGEVADREPGREFEEQLLTALDEALDGLNAFREREGAELAAEIAGRRERISGAAVRIEEIRARAFPLLQARLKERLEEILNGAPLDPQRLVQEAAVLADRSDIGEEVARLKIHARELGEILAVGGEIGKRMDFLLQEMQREANTILSKTGGIGETGLEITGLALQAKSDIEKIREQALNLE
jgi:uncharacterized protein (TIGR00255 family)